MNRFTRLFLFSILIIGCTPKNSDDRQLNGVPVNSMVAEFPAEKLDELVSPITQDELAEVAEEGESGKWIREVFDVENEEIVIRHKEIRDNSVRFIVYRSKSSNDMLGVQQINAQITSTEVWEYHKRVDHDRPERWNQYLLPDYKLEDFFDDRVKLPGEYSGTDANAFVDFNLSQKWITVTLNRWSFMRDLDLNKMEPEGALDPSRIKYKYSLEWNGSDFVQNKTTNPGYNEELLFTSNVVETNPDGPGEREFACPHAVRVTASSSLAPQGRNNYKATNVLDNLPSSAWAEGVEGDGTGEWIEFEITGNFRIGDIWQMKNGYNKSDQAWDENNRIKKFTVSIDGEVAGVVVLANTASWQTFNIAPSWLKSSTLISKGTRIRFTILEVYKGSKFSDTLITFLFPTGNCG